MAEINAINNEEKLEKIMSAPTPAVIAMMQRLDGDIMILGIGGKMGVTLGRQAVNAVRQSGVKKKIYGVSRFNDAAAREKLEQWGIETIAADLLDYRAVKKLPLAENVVFMAGRKFGTDAAAELTWAMNAVAPAHAAEHFRQSRITIFSTGCVYPLVGVETGGCTEETVPGPVGEYAQSCLARERIFGYFSQLYDTPVLLLRLNYAIDLRYGVLHDIACKVIKGEAVNTDVGHFNALWQGDANAYALLSLEHCANPAVILNVTGPETASVAYIAEKIGHIAGKKVSYAGSSGNKCYLNNAAKSFSWFGYPSVSLETMIEWQTKWLMAGNRSLGKPTHFEVNDGKF